MKPANDTAKLIEAAQGATLDTLFRRAALGNPAKVALVDPPHRRTFADGPPRHITYAAADRVIEAIARRLHHFGLPRQSIVGLHCPNIVEGVLALLGIWRAGLIAAPLPLLWRRSDVAETLGCLGAKAIIAAGRVAGEALCDVALATAVEVFSIRYVCGFGEELPDGVVSFDELFTTDRLDPAPWPNERDNPAAEVAIVTWEITPHGRVAMARSDTQLLAAGSAVALETELAQDAKILTSLGLASCAGIATSVIPWLLCGGTLLLHHGLDAQALTEQYNEYGCDVLAMPAPMAPQIAAEGLLPARPCCVLGVWQAPERAAASPRWRDAYAKFIDVFAFGEIGLLPVQRKDGTVADFTIGPAMGAGAAAVSEIMRTRGGTMAVRGPMVPVRPFAERGLGSAVLAADAAGFVDTGYPCRVDGRTGVVTISGPPAGMVNVGSYRFVQRDLQSVLDPIGGSAALAAVPDPLLSYRIVGSADDRRAAQAALAQRGANALMVSAFRERRRPRAA
ncbi:MAG TPA: class I adenylate-forming enzyme family protein [Xanthobacteraceae bacterium]|nr:class I adenylate-forming enzyme family protein [Xanthobacteraceae bacterium]